MRGSIIAFGSLLFAALGAQTAKALPYQFGFEDNKQPSAYDPTFEGPDWFVFQFDDPNNSAVVSSGGGTLGLTAKEGTHYLELHELNDGWFTGRSSSGTAHLPGSRTGVYQGDWYQAMAIYVDPQWAAPGDTADFALGISAAPTATGGGYFTERLASLRVPGNGTVEVQFNQSTVATITQAGWYNFAIDFYRSGNQTTDPFLVNYFVTNGADYLVASLMGTAVAGWGGGPFPSSQLADQRYAWLLGQNDFPSNRSGLIGLDDIRYGEGSYAQFVLTPEPASLLGMSLCGLALIRRRRA